LYVIRYASNENCIVQFGKDTQGAKYIWIKNYSVKQKHNNNISKKFKEGNNWKVNR